MPKGIGYGKRSRKRGRPRVIGGMLNFSYPKSIVRASMKRARRNNKRRIN